MTYVLWDVHGHYECYLDFLQCSCFLEKDTMYIVGDASGEEASLFR